MRKGKTRICPECGKVIQPGGMGGHMQLAHGIIIKKVIRETRGETRGETREMRETGGETGETRETGGRIQRPSDFVKKHEEVVETHIEPVFKLSNVENYVKCDYCGNLSDMSHHNSSVPGKRLCFWCSMRFRREKYHDKPILG